jgi:hypothetical protein
MSSSTGRTLWDDLKSFVEGNIVVSINEINRLIPDSILFGALLMYILTNNISFGVFGIFILEMMLSHKIISWVFSQTTGDSRPNVSDHCRVGFRTPRFEVDRMLSLLNYPSEGIFSIASIGTYLGLGMGYFKNTLNAMGAEWNSRYSVAIGFILTLVSIVIISTFTKGCSSFGEIAIATVLGIFIGLIFFYINKAIFTQESMNFLGLPFLVNKNEVGSPIYVCSTQPNNSS